MRLKAVVVTVAFFSSIVAHSQWADYRGWTSLSLSQKVAKKTLASADVAMRWDRDFSRLGSTFIDASISREVLKDITASVALRVGASSTEEYQWESQRRVAGALRYKNSLNKKSSLSIRLQGQTGLKGIAPLDLSTAARIKTTYFYKLSKKHRLSLSTEVFFRPLYSNYEWSDTRFRVAVRKKVRKRRFFTFGYQLETPRNGPDPWVEHTIICNFSLEKKRRKSDK